MTEQKEIRLLLVEDNPADQKLYSRFLDYSAVTYNISTVDNLTDGISKAAENDFDIVLLDLTLPDSRGLDTFNRFSEACPDVPVVVMSGLDEHDTIDSVLEQGGQEYLVKGTFNEVILNQVIQHTLKRYALLFELQTASTAIQRILDTTPQVVLLLDRNRKVTYINHTGEELTGYTLDEIRNKSWLNLCVTEQSRADTRKILDTALGEVKQAEEYQNWIHTKNGRLLLIQWSYSSLVERDGSISGILNSGKDITDNFYTTEKVRRLEQVVAQSPVGILITDSEGFIEYANPSLEQMSGFNLESMKGKTPRIFKTDETPARVHEDLWKTVKGGEIWRGEVLNRRSNGSTYWESMVVSPLKDSKGRVSHMVALKEDMTEKLWYEERLLQSTHFDLLTGLPNRVLAIDRIKQELEVCRKNDTKLAVMFIDIDNFKRINETLGHECGDLFLKECARRLTNFISEEHTVARISADEYLVILSRIKDIKTIQSVAIRLLEELAHPQVVKGQEVIASASIGISLFPEDGKSEMLLLKHSESAMNLAKKVGRNTFRFFTSNMNVNLGRQFKMDVNLRKAVSNGELTLFFQPIVNSRDGIPARFEVLLRWHNPELGWVSPEDFIPLAEDNGTINEIGTYVIEQSAAILADWHQRYNHLFKLAVNVSYRQFEQGHFEHDLRSVLAKFNLPGDCIEIEITERVLIEESSSTIKTLDEIKAMGMGLSLDDFGTGYSSLSYLKNFSFDILKIDKSFINDLGVEENKNLVTAIVSMAHSMKLKTVAEGVETETQAAFLQGLGCEFLQGYFYGKPASAEETEQAFFSSIIENSP